MSRSITIGWDAPTTGPKPDYYVVRRYDQGLVLPAIIENVYGTEWTGVDPVHEHKYIVRSVANGIESADSLPLYRSFAITGIKPVERNDADAGTVIVGILVTFATEPHRAYWIEKSTDGGTTWHEIGHIFAWDNSHSIGGDASSPNARYRVWERI